MQVPPRVSGYCECDDLRRVHESTCDRTGEANNNALCHEGRPENFLPNHNDCMVSQSPSHAKMSARLEPQAMLLNTNQVWRRNKMRRRK